jgi:hypothetical protein
MLVPPMWQEERSWWDAWCKEVYKHADSHQSELQKVKQLCKDKDLAFKRTLGALSRCVVICQNLGFARYKVALLPLTGCVYQSLH